MVIVFDVVGSFDESIFREYLNQLLYGLLNNIMIQNILSEQLLYPSGVQFSDIRLIELLDILLL